jgi:hypothetical protein
VGDAIVGIGSGIGVGVGIIVGSSIGVEVGTIVGITTTSGAAATMGIGAGGCEQPRTAMDINRVAAKDRYKLVILVSFLFTNSDMLLLSGWDEGQIPRKVHR